MKREKKKDQNIKNTHDSDSKNQSMIYACRGSRIKHTTDFKLQIFMFAKDSQSLPNCCVEKSTKISPEVSIRGVPKYKPLCFSTSTWIYVNLKSLMHGNFNKKEEILEDKDFKTLPNVYQLELH